MLTTFPDLLVLGFFAPTIIRIAVALSFVSIAYLQWKRHTELSEIKFPIIGRSSWWVSVSILLHVALASAMLFGYYTQIAALIGMVVFIKQAIFAKRYPRAVPLCRGEYVLLVFMCFSLLISGAGALAYDLPL